MSWWNDKVDTPGKMSKAAKTAANDEREHLGHVRHEIASTISAVAVLSRARRRILAFPFASAANLQAYYRYERISSARGQSCLRPWQKNAGSLWVDAAASYSWDSANARGLGPDRFGRAWPMATFGRKSMQVDDRTGKPRDKDRFAGPIRLWPLVARRLFQAVGMWTAASAVGLKRFRHEPQPSRLQSRLCASR